MFNDIPILPLICGILLLGGLFVLGYVMYVSRKKEENSHMTSIPSGRQLELEEFEPTLEDEWDGDEYPLVEVKIWRWKDVARTIVEHIIVTCESTSGYEYANGKLTLAWENDGIISIDSDQPGADEELDSDGDEKQRSWSRVFAWVEKDLDEEPDTSDDHPGTDWEPENIVKLVLEDGSSIMLELDGYDELNALTPEFVLESGQNGVIRMTDPKGTTYLDTDDAYFVIGFAFIEIFTLD